MNIHRAIDVFLDHLRVERALSKNTLEAYARDLGALAAHLEDGSKSAEVAQIDAGDISELLSKNVERGIGARSSSRQLSALRGFFKFLVREKEIAADPTSMIDRPKLGRRLPRVFSFEEISRLLEKPDITQDRGVRDAAMIHLMYASGLRVS